MPSGGACSSRRGILDWDNVFLPDKPKQPSVERLALGEMHSRNSDDGTSPAWGDAAACSAGSGPCDMACTLIPRAASTSGLSSPEMGAQLMDLAPDNDAAPEPQRSGGGSGSRQEAGKEPSRWYSVPDGVFQEVGLSLHYF